MNLKRKLFYSLLSFLFIAQNLFALSYFELHNIDKAHASGASGKNVHVGIIDNAFNLNHISLLNKGLELEYFHTSNGSVYTPNFSQDTHGSYVAGIILGSKIDYNLPYGIAYEAKFYGLGLPFQTSASSIPDIYNFFKAKDEVKIINNSWGGNTYPIAELKFDENNQLVRDDNLSNISSVLELFDDPSNLISPLRQLSSEKNVLSVFAAGNEGILSPNLQSSLPRYDESVRSWLSVGALDSSYISKDENGKLIVNGRAVAIFSNAFIGAENFSLSAAGVDIKSAYANSSDRFASSSGTSMAAPIVSGVAALVQEKFPFLNGAQIADVLLSTANKDYQAPKLVIKGYTEGSGTNAKASYTLVYIDQAVPSDEAQIRADIQALYNNPETIDLIMQNLSTTQPTQQVSKEEIFGQGILDAQKALNGLSILDANRLNLKDIQTHNNKEQAFYTINTQAYTGEFSNDISQKLWDDTLHLNSALNSPAVQMQTITEVGLIKQGAGTLILSGSNTYEGDTIVREGTLLLTQRANSTGGSLLSPVFIEKQGILKALNSSSLEQNLDNQGKVEVGDERKLAKLEVKGDYTQENASLSLSFNTQDSSELIATSYTINANSKLILTPIIADIAPKTTSIAIDFKSLTPYLSNFNEMSFASSSVFDFKLSSDQKSIETFLKYSAYDSPFYTQDLSLALRELALLSSGTSETFFKELNAQSTNDKTKSFQSIGENAYLKYNSYFSQNQDKLNLENILELSNSKQDFIALSPNLSYAFGDDFKASLSSVKLNAFKNINENFELAGFLNYARANFKADFSDIKAHQISSGMHAGFDLNFAKLIFGASFALSQSDYERSIYQQDFTLKSKYNTYFTSAQLGLSKDLALNDYIELSPMLYANYSFAYQPSFKENKAILSTNYKSLSHQELSALAGANLNFLLSKGQNFDFKLDLFSFYEQKIIANKLSHQAFFQDNKSFTFTNSLQPDKNALKLGANLSFDFKQFSLLLGLNNSFYSKLNDLNLNAKIHYVF